MPRKQKEPTVVTLGWRDENYGSVHAASAFRVLDHEPYMSDTAYGKMVAKFRKHGFQINHTRAAWIAENPKPGYLERLVAELEALGCVLKHEGNVPDELRKPAEDPSEEPAAEETTSFSM